MGTDSCEPVAQICASFLGSAAAGQLCAGLLLLLLSSHALPSRLAGSNALAVWSAAHLLQTSAHPLLVAEEARRRTFHHVLIALTWFCCALASHCRASTGIFAAGFLLVSWCGVAGVL
jgi:hypothetical protein